MFGNFEIKQINIEAVEKAETKKKAKKILTMEEAWQKIGQMKNSEADKAKLREVFIAFQTGVIGREIGSEGKSFSKAEAIRLHKQLQEMQRSEKLEELVEKTPDWYITPLTTEELYEMANTVKIEPVIAVDTETTGLNLYGRDKVVGVTLTAPQAQKSYYVPLRHDEANAPFDLAMEIIKEILENDSEKIFANASFDLHQLYNEGIEVKGNIHDVIEIMKLLNENEPSYRLKDLATKFLKMPSDTFDVLFGKDCRFNTVPLKYARYYGAHDGWITWLLFSFQMKHLKAQEGLFNYYTKVEQPLIKVVWEMEREGFYLDMEEVKNQKKMLEERIPQLESQLKEHLGDINFGSPAQLLPALQRVVNPNIKGTGKADIKPYKDHPVMKLLKQFKDDSKQLNGFVTPIQNFIQPDGKIHSSFKQNGARTGRFSSGGGEGVNIQQQPYEARKMFKVDDDSLILSLDFKAQEPKMLTHYCQEPILIENYQNNKDLYATLASEFYGLPYEQCYKNPDGSDTEQRVHFKVVVLAIMYSMGAKSLGMSLGISTQEAQEFLDKFNKKFPKVAEFVSNNTKEACEQGFVEMRLGDMVRKRRLPFFKGENPNRVYDTYSTNAKVQGTAAFQTKMCMIEGNKLCKELSTPGRTFALLATVHDELLYRVPKDVTKEELKQLANIMIETVELNNVPSGTDGALGNCWGKLKSVEVA